MDKNCLYCQYFVSYQDQYDDPLESWECGWCYNSSSEYHSEHVDEDDVCDLYCGYES